MRTQVTVRSNCNAEHMTLSRLAASSDLRARQPQPIISVQHALPAHASQVLAIEAHLQSHRHSHLRL